MVSKITTNMKQLVFFSHFLHVSILTCIYRLLRCSQNQQWDSCNQHGGFGHLWCKWRSWAEGCRDLLREAWKNLPSVFPSRAEEIVCSSPKGLRSSWIVQIFLAACGRSAHQESRIWQYKTSFLEVFPAQSTMLGKEEPSQGVTVSPAPRMGRRLPSRCPGSSAHTGRHWSCTLLHIHRSQTHSPPGSGDSGLRAGRSSSWVGPPGHPQSWKPSRSHTDPERWNKETVSHCCPHLLSLPAWWLSVHVISSSTHGWPCAVKSSYCPAFNIGCIVLLLLLLLVATATIGVTVTVSCSKAEQSWLCGSWHLWP